MAIKHVEEHAKKLSHDDPKVRESAQGDLIKIGKSALWKVQELKKSSDPEVKQRGIAIEDEIKKGLRKRPFKTGNVVDGINLTLKTDKTKYKLGDDIVLSLEIKNVRKKDASISYDKSHIGFGELGMDGLFEQFDYYTGFRDGFILFERIKGLEQLQMLAYSLRNSPERKKHILKQGEVFSERIIIRLSREEPNEYQPIATKDKIEFFPGPRYIGKGEYEITFFLANNKFVGSGYLYKLEPSTSKKSIEKKKEIFKSLKKKTDLPRMEEIAGSDEELHSNTLKIVIGD